MYLHRYKDSVFTVECKFFKAQSYITNAELHFYLAL